MNRFEKWSVLVSATATAATGAAYFGIEYFFEPSDPWAVINHPLQPWLLKAHILVAPLLVFAVGMIAVRHVWEHFRRSVRLGRRTGLLTAAVFAPMVVTGYLIQSVTVEAWLEPIAWAHIGASVVFSAGIAAHAAVVLRRRDPDNSVGPRVSSSSSRGTAITRVS